MTSNQTSNFSLTTNVSRNAQAIIIQLNFNASDAILIAWNVPMEARNALNATKTVFYRGIHASNSAELTLSIRIYSLKTVSSASHHVRHAAYLLLSAIAAYRQFLKI